MLSKDTVSSLLRIIVISSPLWLNDFYFPFLPKEADKLRAILDFLFYVCWQTTLIYMAFAAGWFAFSDLGLRKDFLIKQTIQGFLLFLAVMLIAIGLAAARLGLIKFFNIQIPPPGHSPLPQWNPFLVFFYVIYLAVTAGVYEEVVYRGIVISQLRKISKNSIFLTCGSALVFALVHWSLGPSILILAFSLGLFWAILFIRSGSLLPLMIAHGLFDFVTFYDLHNALFKLLGMDG